MKIKKKKYKKIMEDKYFDGYNEGFNDGIQFAFDHPELAEIRMRANKLAKVFLDSIQKITKTE